MAQSPLGERILVSIIGGGDGPSRDVHCLITIRQAAKIAILVPSLAGSGTLVSNKNININEF